MILASSFLDLFFSSSTYLPCCSFRQDNEHRSCVARWILQCTAFFCLPSRLKRSCWIRHHIHSEHSTAWRTSETTNLDSSGRPDHHGMKDGKKGRRGGGFDYALFLPVLFCFLIYHAPTRHTREREISWDLAYGRARRERDWVPKKGKRDKQMVGFLLPGPFSVIFCSVVFLIPFAGV